MNIADTPDQIDAFRLLALKGALKLESFGMKRSRGPSALSMVKKEFGLKGNAKKVLADFEAILQSKGVLVETRILR